MRIPKEFSVKGKLWRVEYKWRLTHPDGTVCDGLCEGSTRTIYLAHGLGEDKVSTFLHEYVHAIFYEYGLHVAGIPDGVEDLICEMIAMEFGERFRLRWKKCVD